VITLLRGASLLNIDLVVRKDYNHEIMKIIYDPNTDTMTIILKESVVAESDEEKKGIIIDYDNQGDMVSLEILDARKRITQPTQLVYELADQAVES
jgi:uncharacterized protein YuzE